MRSLFGSGDDGLDRSTAVLALPADHCLKRLFGFLERVPAWFAFRQLMQA
jgi:hypothetical protein